MPDDYIKRSDAVFAVQKRIEQIGMGNNPLVCSIRQAVRDAPAADVEPVRRGKWIPINISNPSWSQFGIAQYKCSECGSEEMIARKRCPECGAYMDAKRGREGKR